MPIKSPLFIASALVLLAEMCFAGVSALVKHTSQLLPYEHLVFFRNLFALIILLPWILKKRGDAFKTQQPGLHILRACLGIAAMYLFFWVIATIPLAQATLVLLMAPFIIPVISHFWLKESITLQVIMAIAIGFSGAIIFLSPWQQAIHPMVFVALIAACFAAFTKTVIRKLSVTESSSKIVFYFSFLATLLSALPMMLRWQPVPVEAWPGIVGIGVLAVAGQLAMTKGFGLASPSKVGVFTYSSVIFAALLGYWVWGEAITHEMILGTVLIFIAGYFALKRQKRTVLEDPTP
ncbi:MULTISPECIES: DMT family transporter [Gammaproteobacteria]|uniref:DMT family transporter n=1 Tax=Gammaproteobacteria TaxID=1236 RepID=UPI000DCFAE61|nr:MULTISPECIES: DMT family transporter [Gammaproteobacteria]RTE87444.1 DMT family transporter [Aliidiomarina sp. B3213]TCZ92771.1 DMT family transporter [Lysobacter sp. N42]